MDTNLQKYLIAIDASDFSNNEKLYWKVKVLFLFEFIEKGAKQSLNDFDAIYSTTQHNAKFKELYKNWNKLEQHIQAILEN